MRLSEKAARQLRLPRNISVKFVVGVDTPTLVREYGIEPADGPRLVPSSFQSDMICMRAVLV